MADQEPPLTPLERLRRVFITGHSCVRNFAYYRAARSADTAALPLEHRDVKARITNNFLDIGVLEWCKLFVANERHAWDRLIPQADRDKFTADLPTHLGINQAGWTAYIDEFRTYRDKFLAHLDSNRTMHPPKLDLAIEAVLFYASHLQQTHAESKDIHPADMDLRRSFETAQKAGAEYFR